MTLQNPGQRACRQAPQLPPLSSLPHGYSICLVFLKLFERSGVPLTAGLLSLSQRRSPNRSAKAIVLDRLYQRVVDDLDAPRSRHKVAHDKGAKREQNPPYSHYNGF